MLKQKNKTRQGCSLRNNFLFYSMMICFRQNSILFVLSLWLFFQATLRPHYQTFHFKQSPHPKNAKSGSGNFNGIVFSFFFTAVVYMWCDVWSGSFLESRRTQKLSKKMRKKLNVVCFPRATCLPSIHSPSPPRELMADGNYI